MVIAGIVGDHDHPSRSRGAGPVEGFQEDKEGSTVELVGLAMKEELAVAKPNRTKVTYAAASRMMEQNRVLGLRRDPHLTARTMLLKMHLVGCPQVHLRIGYQRLEFFYAPSGVADPPAPPWDAVCVNGIPIVETLSGTGAPPSGLHTVVRSMRTRPCRPIDCPPCLPLAAPCAERHLPPPIASGSADVADPGVRLPANPPTPPPRNAAPSIRPNGEHRPVRQRLLGRSNLVPLRARHVSGDRSVILRIVESHPAAQEPPWRSQQREVLSCPHENTVSHYAQLLMCCV